jgi:poly(hydroxyalkanoate) depolymerase family esterase
VWPRGVPLEWALAEVIGYAAQICQSVGIVVPVRGVAGVAARATTWALVVAVLACLPSFAAAAPDPSDPGQTTSGTVTSNGADYQYLLYTPKSYVPGRAAPLLVMVHGCQTTAEQEMKVTLFNKVAEREGFVVLYSDVDALGRAQPGPANQCWKFPYPPAWTRDNSDAGAIADMTRAIMAKRSIDPERVYLEGISAGGLMASIDAAAYPDLFAAVGILESSAYADWTCFTTGVGIPVTTSAQLAFDQMGPRARVVPIFVMGGDADLAFPATCTAKALEQGLRTDNLVLSGSQDGPISLIPATIRQAQQPGGYAYTVSTYRDPAGCLIGERWLVHGLAHMWPGGGTDPSFPGDPLAPDGAEASWAFLKRYRKTDTAMPCAEAPVTPVRATICPARTVTVMLARGARVRSVRASVAGRRVRTRIRGRRVRLTLPSGRKGAVRVLLRVRRQGRSRAQLVRRTFARC